MIIRLRFLQLIMMVPFSTPVLAVLPDPFILQRADPWIYRNADGRYFFTATVPSYDRIELRSADSLKALPCAEPVTIWHKHEKGPMSYNIWAPELHYIDGKWYVYFAAGEADDIWHIRMYVLENNSANPLTGEWMELGRIKTPLDSFALDATTFSHRHRRYLVWAQHEPGFDGNTALWIAEMDSPWSIAGQPVKLSEPEYDWEIQRFKVNEGPAVLIQNGKIFLTYSASGVDHNYCMGMLTADGAADLLDPAAWQKSAQPVFRTSDVNGIYGPGHNCFTTDDNGLDLLVYHARNYKEVTTDPLEDPNRHARIQPITWRSNGTPDFGMPVPETPGQVADKPLYRDPVQDGAADPVVVWNPHRGRWWMFYTNRRARDANATGVTWVHGTRIGIAESCDGGANWKYMGTAAIDLPESVGGTEPTHWAPEVFTDANGLHHMLLTVVPGIFEDWSHPRTIVHLTSRDLFSWSYQSALSLASDRVIDACILRMADSTWRMWYNNERDGKSIYWADSTDLKHWEGGGRAVSDRPGEGPKVFRWKGFYWMITDVWRGLGVYRSDDALTWTRQEGDNLLQHPGAGPDDGANGQHPDVIVQGDRAYLFYFTHPGRTGPNQPDGYQARRSSIQVTELKLQDDRLSVDRDQPVHISLDPGRQ